MSQPEPSAQRIGDAERDLAVTELREHHAAGRIDATEFEDRMDAALHARTQGELDVLFADLPGLRPTTSRQRTRRRTRAEGHELELAPGRCRRRLPRRRHRLLRHRLGLLVDHADPGGDQRLPAHREPRRASIPPSPFEPHGVNRTATGCGVNQLFAT